ncbi:MAG: YdeI/OmpD-associated family protein [Chloroflexota bacterium]
MSQSIMILAEIKQKMATLPRYVEVDEEKLATWGLEGTTPIEVKIEGHQPVLRNIKRWGKKRPVWFFELTAAMCKHAKIDTGDTIEFTLTKIKDEIAAEIQTILETNLAAQDKWDKTTPSQRRMINDHVLGAKQAATRLRRARKVFGISEG